MNSTLENPSNNCNDIQIDYLNHPACASYFLRKLKKIFCNSDTKQITLQGAPEFFFPNAILPITGIMEYYKEQGYQFLNNIDSPSLFATSFMNPCNYTIEQLHTLQNPFNKVFRIESDEQVDALSQAYVDSLSKSQLCGEGVLDGINWCIAEVMDNVLTHSGANYGLVMAQIHQTSKHIAFCIYDAGLGIYNTLSPSAHKPQSESDALSMAIQEGVSDGLGQGNGLYGLYQIVKNNKGSLSITSGHTSLMMDGSGEIKKISKIPFLNPQHCGTIVDFQLDFSKNINMKEAFRSLGGFNPFDVRIDDMLSLEDDDVHYHLLDYAQGTATRRSGAFLRNDITNTYTRTHRHIILDFSGIQTVSSSFIDELIAKLVLQFGFVEFNQIFTISNMNPGIRYLCNRSLYIRIYDEWKSNFSAQQ